jgi:hypothetical protein
MAAATAKVAVVVASRRRRVRGLRGMTTVLSQGFGVEHTRDARTRQAGWELEQAGPFGPF